ncbi:peptidase associated/transthyretin-like domain-containing protein [Comamonas composti]|uniref:hypothetical protein n=1 Tax=Comamonas composti TaxID=408558 RepID=UPI00047CF566|nr:hypothetical protein [Comamonas composti]
MNSIQTTFYLTLMALLAGCGGEDEIQGPVWVSKGNFSDESGSGIADARISVELDRTYSATTDAYGNYQLRLPKDYNYPEHFSGLALKDGILPKPVLFSYKNAMLSFNNKVTSRPTKESDVIFQSSLKVTHLGDSNYGGTVNSQFQLSQAQATYWFDSFTFSEVQKSKYSRLCLSFYVKGLQRMSGNAQSTISVSKNGQPGSYVVSPLMPSNADGSYTRTSDCFSLALFQAQDVIRVQVNSLANSGGDFDDFEFIAMTGTLE